jgi:hypothetical protein
VHPTAARFQERLHERGLDVSVVMLPDSARTAESLRRFATVWSAAGTPHAVFEADTDALIGAIPGGAVLEIS